MENQYSEVERFAISLITKTYNCESEQKAKEKLDELMVNFLDKSK